jgi:hypothetical protein
MEVGAGFAGLEAFNGLFERSCAVAEIGVAEHRGRTGQFVHDPFQLGDSGFIGVSLRAMALLQLGKGLALERFNEILLSWFCAENGISRAP